MPNITSNTRITFGDRRGTKIRDLPNGYLNWMNKALADGDFHDWALAAREELSARARDNNQYGALEEQADEFLRRHGYDPKRM